MSQLPSEHLMDADGLPMFLLVAFGFAAAAAAVYFYVESRWRWRWREVEIGREPIHADDGDLYRASGTVPVFLPRAPRLVRAAAYSSLLFGQLFVPGLLIGGVGLALGGIGLVMIPGLIANGKLYAAALLLLRREPRLAYFRARNAAAWCLWVHGIIFALSLGVTALLWRWWDEEVWLFFALVNGYGAVCSAQALLLRHAVVKHADALFVPTEAVKLGGHLYRTPPEALS